MLWLGGNALLSVRWGWAVADLPIAAGAVLILLGLAQAARRWARPVFRVLDRAGALSLPLFLVHLPVMYVTAATQPLWGAAVWTTALAMILTVAALWAASATLVAFDRSLAAEAVVRWTLDPLLGRPAP